MSAFQKDIDFAQLIPELQDWNNGTGISIDEWVQCEANHKVLIGCVRILWHDFIEYDGCVFRKDRFSEQNYRAFMQQSNGNKTSVETTMNHEHIVDLFATERPTREIVIYVGNLIKEIWQTKLTHDFPSRKITVWFPEENDLEDLLDYQVTFFQER